jgi:hypothetical protein
VDNNLLGDYGFDCGDIITFKKKNIGGDCASYN